MRTFAIAEHRGITLLEVLISIGILAVGLLGTLALIPAGGTYLRKSQTESRAAALIPNAFSTMDACGLFGENAIDWQENSALVDEDEGYLLGYPRYPRDIDETSVDGAVIHSFHETRDDPPWITGQLAQGETGPITVTADGPNSVAKTISPPPPDAEGKWWHPVSADEFSLSSPPVDSEERMTVMNSGANPDSIDVYYDEWSFSVDKGDIDVTPPSTPARESDADAVTAYRHYRKRRRYGFTYGDALLDFTQPTFSEAVHQKNDTKAYAQPFIVPGNADRVTRRIQGELWRYEVGYRQGRYQYWKRYSNFFRDGPIQPVISQWYESTDQGTQWVDSVGSPQGGPDGVYEGSVDYYCFDAIAGQEFEIDWSGTYSGYLNQSFSDGFPQDAFLVEDQSGPLSPIRTGTRYARYKTETGGTVYISVELLDQGADSDDPNYAARLNNGFDPGRPARYEFTVTVFGTQSVAVIDPLMASHLRAVNPSHSRIGIAAEFPQRIPGAAGTVSFPIRRLNWNIVADLVKAADAVAVAETLCRPADVLEVDDIDGDALSAPGQRYEVGELSSCHSAAVYDRYAGGWAYCEECGLQTQIVEVPLKRECDDRMSWMLTIQPEGEGAIQSNWRAGNYFDVAIAVFQDRLFPGVSDTVLEGEHWFDSWWDDATGLISIPILRSSGIDQDDIRRMFTAGNWIMIAPKEASSNQKIDWVQIQTCEFDREANRTVARILPVSEPNTGTAKGTASLDAAPANLVAVVFQGVVAVARRSIQITE